MCRVQPKGSRVWEQSDVTKWLREAAASGEAIDEILLSYRTSPQARAAGRWFVLCSDRSNIDWYLKDTPNSELVAVDVPVADLEKYRVCNLGPEGDLCPRSYSLRPGEEFFLPPALAKQARPIP